MSLLKLGKDNWARTSPTREGLAFISLSFIVGFAAINTSNNLLYLIFGIMLSLVIISGVFSMINLSRIEVKLKKISDIYALTPSFLIFSLTNDKYLIPAFSLTLKLKDNKTFLAYLPSKKSRDLSVKCFFSKRGLNTIPEATLHTKFPFGFFKKWIKVDIPNTEVLVYPKIFDTEIDLNNTMNEAEDVESKKSGHGSELQTIREYVDGDNTKNIDWKNSAKMNNLMVKQYFQDETNIAKIIFEPENNKLKDIEHYISEKASLLVEYIKNGFSVEFITNEKSFKVSSGRKHLSQVLRYLALY